jgi:hypothetical protein
MRTLKDTSPKKPLPREPITGTHLQNRSFIRSKSRRLTGAVIQSLRGARVSRDRTPADEAVPNGFMLKGYDFKIIYVFGLYEDLVH